MIEILKTIVPVVLMLAIGFVVHAVGMGAVPDPALNIIFILPPPYVLPVFADDETQRNFVSSSLSVTTLITIVCFMILTVITK